MGASRWAAPFRFINIRRLLSWLLLLGGFGFVRWSKGAAFSDIYALISRPFWPGSAQKEWLQASSQVEQELKLSLLEQDNQRLRQLLSLKQSAPKNLVAAPVISRSPKGWWQKLELGKGSINGINPGDPVLGPGGLLGSIHSVTPSTARVMLLTAPGSQVGVWTSRTKRHGMLMGIGTSRPQLVFLDNDPNVFPGDVVSTAPASMLFPPNLPIGVIQSLNERAWPTPHAVVQLLASPEAIDWVQVQVR